MLDITLELCIFLQTLFLEFFSLFLLFTLLHINLFGSLILPHSLLHHNLFTYIPYHLLCLFILLRNLLFLFFVSFLQLHLLKRIGPGGYYIILEHLLVHNGVLLVGGVDRELFLFEGLV